MIEMASSSENNSKHVMIKTMDEVIHNVDIDTLTEYFKKVAVKEVTGSEATTVDGASNVATNKLKNAENELITLPKINSDTLKIVLSWINKEKVAGRRKADFELFQFEKEMFSPMDPMTICSVVEAAESLGLESLIEVLSSVLALKIKGKSVEEVRSMFGIVCDLSPEELERIRAENAFIEDIDE